MSIIFGMLSLSEKIPERNIKSLKGCQAAQHFHNACIYFQAWIKSQFVHHSQCVIAHDPEANLTIILDARISNRTELAETLGCQWQIDSELILQAYKKWGSECVKYLVGEFAFAIWDGHLKQMMLGQDPIGQRTLFYKYDTDQQFYFANLVRPILEYSPSTLNRNQIGYYLTLIESDTETCFKDIKQVPAGHILIINLENKKLKIKRYWSAEECVENPLHLACAQDYYDHCLELFQKVIKESLHFYPLASQLSGGLDSSAVTCMAAVLLQSQNKGLETFSHVPTVGTHYQPTQNWNYDDKHYIKLVAKKYENIKLNFILDSDKDFFALDSELHYWLEHPPLNPCNLLWLLTCVEQVAALGLNYILCGTVGNFTLSWSGFNIHLPQTLLGKMRQQISIYRKHMLDWKRGRRLYRPWGNFSAVSDILAGEINLRQYYKKMSPLENRYKILDDRLFVFGTGIRCITTSIYTVIRHLYGVSFLDPTADRRLVEFCLRTPKSIFYNEMGSRLMLRESMRNIIPEPIRTRTTRGMQSADWYKKLERQKHKMQQLLLSWRKSEVADFIDIQALLTAIKKWDYDRVARSQGKEYTSYELLYRSKLLRAVEMGLYIQNNL